MIGLLLRFTYGNPPVKNPVRNHKKVSAEGSKQSEQEKIGSFAAKHDVLGKADSISCRKQPGDGPDGRPEQFQI